MHFRLAAILAVLVSRIGLAADVIISPNMGMPVPVVGQAPGPDWANDINASLSIIDSHDHTPGYGVQVPPGGLNINSDLTFQGNNATNLRSARFTAQGSPISGGSDLGALYVSGADLYYNDEAGNQVRITQGGSVTGSSGTITGLPSGTASASYASPTFTFLSATNTPAKMSVGPVTIGTNAVSPKTVTLAPPGGLAANYNLTLPNGLPGSTSVLEVDASGNMSSLGTTGSGNAVLATSASLTTPTIAGGALSGTFSGTPTFSANITFGADIVVNNASANNSVSLLNPGASGAGNAEFEVDTGTSDALHVDKNANATIKGSFNLKNSANNNTGTISNSGASGAGNAALTFATGSGTALVLDKSGNATITGYASLGGTGGNTPHACTRRSNSPGGSGTSASLTCSAGEIISGGGCSVASGSGQLIQSYPDTTATWACIWNSTQTTPTAYGICCSI